MSKELNINRLAACIKWWLNYNASIGREYVLSESAVKFPLAEYLERSNVNDVKLEYPHPKFKKKRFDLYFKNTTTNESVVIEFKYVKNASTKDGAEKQRIFDDLMRLYMYSGRNKKGYFLICGEQAEFIANFQRIIKHKGAIRVRNHKNLPKASDSEGFYTEWFSFDSNQPNKNIIVNGQKNSTYKKIYDEFVKEYKQSYNDKSNSVLVLPTSITTSLIYLSENSTSPDMDYQPSRIGIWEVC